MLLLIVDLSFFIIVRTDAPNIYEEALDGVVTFIKGLGFIANKQTVEAYFILTGFATATISSSILLLLGLGEFRTKD